MIFIQDYNENESTINEEKYYAEVVRMEPISVGILFGEGACAGPNCGTNGVGNPQTKENVMENKEKANCKCEDKVEANTDVQKTEDKVEVEDKVESNTADKSVDQAVVIKNLQAELSELKANKIETKIETPAEAPKLDANQIAQLKEALGNGSLGSAPESKDTNSSIRVIENSKIGGNK
ncbi:MAG: hypothetical protein HAW67_00215 [Endozoicomonadaceae bacterium]|nr:hypothetical protein [Endozoicomonadaceae bacterium]